MKFFIAFFLMNFLCSKKDKIFQLRGGFVNKGGKLMFALNPDKIKVDKLKNYNKKV